MKKIIAAKTGLSSVAAQVNKIVNIKIVNNQDGLQKDKSSKDHDYS